MKNKENFNCMVCEFRIKNGRKWGEWKMECEYQSVEVTEIIVNGDQYGKPSGDCAFDLGYLKAVNWLYQSRLTWSPKQAEFRIRERHSPLFDERTEYVYKMVSQEAEQVSA